MTVTPTTTYGLFWCTSTFYDIATGTTYYDDDYCVPDSEGEMEWYNYNEHDKTPDASVLTSIVTDYKDGTSVSVDDGTDLKVRHHGKKHAHSVSMDSYENSVDSAYDVKRRRAHSDSLVSDASLSIVSFDFDVKRKARIHDDESEYFSFDDEESEKDSVYDSDDDILSDRDVKVKTKKHHHAKKLRVSHYDEKYWGWL